MVKELQTKILIAGGGVGGVACAIAACSLGQNVILTEESVWIGGQFTSQATPPDEHGWIEDFGCTKSYRQFRKEVRRYYKTHYPLTTEAENRQFLNPGNGWVSPICAEPRVYLAVLKMLLKKYTDKGKLQILTEHYPTSADFKQDLVRAVSFLNLQTGENVTICAEYFVDATELGELLPLTNTEFVTGSESRKQTNEPSAKEFADPTNSQAFSMCFALEHYKGENHTIEKPKNYDFWQKFVPDLSPPWSGSLLSLTGINPRTLEAVNYNFQPNKEPNKAFAGLWTYRRILDRENFIAGTFDSDITLVNYPQIDYFLEDLSNVADYAEKQKLIDEAKNLSLSFLYWLQTEAGFSGLKLHKDVVGTADGLAKMPYVRESRRIKAEFTILEQHVSARSLPGKTSAEFFADSVGIGFYRIDLHPTVGGGNYLDVESLPFQIPLGALIPERMKNLLPACKNIGTTHITNGCYRLHPIEWNIGEAVGNLLAFCLENKMRPCEVSSNKKKLKEFQNQLLKNGFELEWKKDLIIQDGDPHRHAT